MNIQYFEPLSIAWKRMKTALFKPFDLTKWFAVGFTAFLAGLLDGFGGNSSNSWRNDNFRHLPDDIGLWPEMIYQWLIDHPGWTFFIISVIVIIFVFIILFNWLSSRGKFMFLHNVVHDYQEIKAPWYDYKKQGNSLFLWRLVYGFLIVLMVFTFIYYGLSLVIDMRYQEFSVDLIMPLVWLIFLFILMMIITSYISLFLNDFIVPIMYKHKVETTEAWGIFLDIFKQHFWHFILYGLFILMLGIITFVAVAFLCLFTCCIALILIILPYIGSVFLLPVSYTFRGLSVAYLEQFGDQFKLFPETVETEN